MTVFSSIESFSQVGSFYSRVGYSFPMALRSPPKPFCQNHFALLGTKTARLHLQNRLKPVPQACVNCFSGKKSPISSLDAALGPRATLPLAICEIRRDFATIGSYFSFYTNKKMTLQADSLASVAVSTKPSDEETMALWNPDPLSQAGKIEAIIQALPIIQELSNDPNWQASRGHLRIPPNLQDQCFTGSLLLSEDHLTVPPFVFTNLQEQRLISVTYLGRALCGHPGVVHGGMLATLLDEGLARACSGAISGKTGVTANLNINYRAPCKAGQFVVMKAEIVKVEGRKLWMKGRLEALPSNDSPTQLFAEAEGLFFEPKTYVAK